MNLLPVTSRTSPDSVEYDRDGRVLYARIASSRSRHVLRTLTGGGINFDTVENGIVSGIEVLLNTPSTLQRGDVSVRPEDTQFYDLAMESEPIVSDVQIYDVNRKILQVGTLDEPAALAYLSNSVTVAISGNRIAVWISNVTLAEP